MNAKKRASKAEFYYHNDPNFKLKINEFLVTDINNRSTRNEIFQLIKRNYSDLSFLWSEFYSFANGLKGDVSMICYCNDYCVDDAVFCLSGKNLVKVNHE
jgi:hypothetical protein